MENQKYTIIKSKKQYFEYCDILWDLLKKDEILYSDDIEHLTLLIEKYDDEYSTVGKGPDLDPIELLKHFMEEHKMKARDLCAILNLSEATVSKILNYRAGLSKDTIRKLASHFKLQQEAFNKPYPLKNPINRKFKNVKLMNTKKEMDGKEP